METKVENDRTTNHRNIFLVQGGVPLSVFTM